MRRVKTMQKIYWLLVLVFFATAAVGYGYGGEEWYDAAYYAVQLFFLNYEPAQNGNIIINVSRFICPVMTATGVFAVLKNAFKIITDGVISKMKDATAIYYNEEEMKTIASKFKHGVLMGLEVNRKVNAHVLMLSDDLANLNFYAQMEEKIKAGSKVYIKLEEMDSKLLRKSNICYFNVNEIISRLYWRERNLQKYLKDGKMQVKIAILGFNALGQELLNYGLINNIYSLDQSIEYHVWGDVELHRNTLGDFDKMNNDRIVYHENSWKREINQLSGFDRIIVSEECNIEMLESLLYLSSDAEIDFYNPTGTMLADVYTSDKLTAFGILEQILTEDNIKKDKLYRAAKEINYHYLSTYGYIDENGADLETVMQEEWEKLSGFHKGSNIACADYHEIRLLAMEKMGLNKQILNGEQEEMLGKMEHIRWSRYYYINHWHYNEKRDDKKREHPCLVAYEELSEEMKQVDKNMVQGLLH